MTGVVRTSSPGWAGTLGGRNNATDARPRGGLDGLAPYVAAERRKGRTWAQIARASGRAEIDLVRRFGEQFP